MERIKTIATRDLTKSVQTGGCGECQTSCQSCLQDFLRRGKPEVREQQQVRKDHLMPPLPGGIFFVFHGGQDGTPV